MSMTVLAATAGGIATVVLGTLSGVVLRDPVRGLAALTHRVERLPLVLADRYLAFAGLTLAATVLGDVRALFALMLALAFMGLADGLIYARAGLPHAKHTLSGVVSLIGAGMTLVALVNGGAQ